MCYVSFACYFFFFVLSLMAWVFLNVPFFFVYMDYVNWMEKLNTTHKRSTEIYFKYLEMKIRRVLKLCYCLLHFPLSGTIRRQIFAFMDGQNMRLFLGEKGGRGGWRVKSCKLIGSVEKYRIVWKFVYNILQITYQTVEIVISIINRSHISSDSTL